MPPLNWPQTILGYPEHTRSGARVVGVAHMSTFAAMRFAEELGIRTGWLVADGALPQLENVRQGAPTSVSLAAMIADRRVVMTEGVAQGTLVFAGASGDGSRPGAEPLKHWAEAHRQVWVEVIDNEISFWGGLSDLQVGRLLTWFLCQHPFEVDWTKARIEKRTLARLRAGLFDHGWIRNLSLVRNERKLCDLWGGVHASSVLEHANRPQPNQVQAGLRLTLDFGEFTSTELAERCPLSDDTGKVVSGRTSGIWSA